MYNAQLLHYNHLGRENAVNDDSVVFYMENVIPFSIVRE